MNFSHEALITSFATLSDALKWVGVRQRDDFEEIPILAARIEFTVKSNQNAVDWPIVIETPQEAWSYAAYLPLPPRVRRVRDAVLRIRTTAVSGEPWIGVLNRDETDFICRRVIPQGVRVMETAFGPLDLRDASRIVVENGARAGISRVQIEIASILAPTTSPDLLPENPGPAEIVFEKTARSTLPSRRVRLGGHVFVIQSASEGDVYFESIRNNFEPAFQEFCRQYVRPDAVCIDIGANIGVKTLFLSRHAQEGRVIAIEAAPSVAKTLELNVRTNNASNVDCVQAAIGDRMGTVRFTESSAYGHISEEGVEVPMRTLADVVDRLSLPSVDFIKIDVEGFEFPILKSAYDLIDRNRALVLFEFNSWCQLAFSDVNPKEFLGWIFERFRYVGILRDSKDGYDLLEQVKPEQLLYVLHDNLVARGCVTDLVVTNATERL